MARILCLPYSVHLVHLLCLRSPTLARLFPRFLFAVAVPNPRVADIKAEGESRVLGVPREMVDDVEISEEDDTGEDGEDVSARG